MTADFTLQVWMGLPIGPIILLAIERREVTKQGTVSMVSFNYVKAVYWTATSQQ